MDLVRETRGLDGNIQRIMSCFLPSKTLGLFASTTALSSLSGRSWVFIISARKRQLEDLKVIFFLANEPRIRSLVLMNSLLLSIEPSVGCLEFPLMRSSEDYLTFSALVAAQQTSPSPLPFRGRSRGSLARSAGRQGHKKDDRFCDFCRKPGHVEDKFWKLKRSPQPLLPLLL